ncbi:MAG: tetratricopeptide repeat protein [Bacteroidales bacterium]|nr:tetratricopeptide repeat protein [Bacteroidales bacterium]
MTRTYLFLILFFTYLNFTLFGQSQSMAYYVAIPHTQQISASNPDYKTVFSHFTADPNAHITVFYTLEIKVYQELENQYSINISIREDSVNGDIYYKLLTLGDLFYPKRIFVNGNLLINGKSILTLQIQNRLIPENKIICDTLIQSIGDSLQWSHKIEYLQFYFDEQLEAKIALRIAKINAYHQNDSLFYQWQKALDKINLSNVDLLPIYKFNLDDIENAATTYVSNQFENLLALSKVDNTNYLTKVSKLFNRINTIKNYLASTLPEMDEMLYRKGKECEQQENYEKAVYYYQRSLDYNPTHCQSCLALSNYYIHQKNYTKPIGLLSNLYKDTSQIIDNHSVANNLYQILLLTAEEEIKKNDYYSALKTLDTLENFCRQMPFNFCDSKYKLLQEEAKQGIYNAYFDVIRQAIRNERFALSINYTQGLKTLMQKNHDSPENYSAYHDILQLLWNNFTKSSYKKLSKKQYTSVLTEISDFQNVLDSSNFDYPQAVFDDIYSYCFTQLYIEKNTEIERLKTTKKTKELSDKIKETEDFYQQHKNYIQSSPIVISQLPETKEDIQQQLPQQRYNKLCIYLNETETESTDYDFLDSCVLAYQWQQNHLFDTCIAWNSILENKCTPLILGCLSHINTFAWGNEFKKAYPLYQQLSKTIITLSMDKDSSILLKYQESKDLLQTRGCHYIERNRKEHYENALMYIRETNFVQAQKELEEYSPIDIECAGALYKDSMDNLQTYIAKPAYFQKLYQQAMDKLSVGLFEEGFLLYEQSYDYFTKHKLDTYGLKCKSWIEFLLETNNTNYYKASCEYYSKQKDFQKAIEIILLATSHNHPLNNTQTNVGKSFRENVISKNQDVKESIKAYTFSQKHTPFLNAYLGKINAYFYLFFH